MCLFGLSVTCKVNKLCWCNGGGAWQGNNRHNGEVCQLILISSLISFYLYTCHANYIIREKLYTISKGNAQGVGSFQCDNVVLPVSVEDDRGVPMKKSK